MALQKALERPRAVDRVVGVVDDVLFGRVGHLEGDLLCLQPLSEVLHLQVDDAADVLLAQRLIEDNLVQTV